MSHPMGGIFNGSMHSPVMNGSQSTLTSVPTANANFRPDATTGTLKTTIMLGKNPSVHPSGPFYLLRPETIEESDLSGSINLLDYYGLESSYQKLSMTRKLRDELSSFLPSLPGFVDHPASEDGSSLKQLFENPPRVRKEIEVLPPHLLSGFRLKPGSLPDRFRLMDLNVVKKLHKKKRKKEEVNGVAHTSDAEGSPEAKKQRRDREDSERRRLKKLDKKRKRREDDPTGDDLMSRT
ncbi:hypothetical protein RvY_13459 [Ramazzottius varieornatus]|uniref:Mediator of RNA polymerase II transcription subunit 19 n=1 Tax=Ramazzottius varieornatus TaxID=947166 RepID=A0A1D1VWG7_RAMVA|nr:hypothetical protein RvY_13459 [Ramazzottius varieornatus]